VIGQLMTRTDVPGSGGTSAAVLVGELGENASDPVPITVLKPSRRRRFERWPVLVLVPVTNLRCIDDVGERGSP